MSRTAATVMFNFTACAYQVVTVDENGSIMDDYTAGNAPGDSQSFVHPDDGVGIETMERYARQTALETATAAGLDDSAVHLDPDMIAELEEVYGGWPD